VMRNNLNKQILNPLIFENKTDYISKMASELENRQSSAEISIEESYNIKETTGGLRDIEAISLMIKCYLGISTPISTSFLKDVKSQLPEISSELTVLGEALYFLRSIRNLYRITVAAEDDLQLKYFIKVADIHYFNELDLWDGSQFLLIQIGDTLNESANACNKIIAYLRDKI